MKAFKIMELPKKCAIYCRVSTSGQDIKTQLDLLPKIHRLISNQAIFRLSENFLRKNRACGGQFFLKYLKRTESVLRKQILDAPFLAECFVPIRIRMLPLTAWDRFHHCNPFSGFNQ